MTFAERRQAVLAEIVDACSRHGRDPRSVDLLAVSKTRSAEAVLEACATTEQRSFGESRVQELTVKAQIAQSDARICWHLIGSLQTNKVGALLDIPARLDLVHSVDRAKLAHALEAKLAERDRELDVLLQVEATGEAAKHGVAITDARGLADAMQAECPHLHLCGLMAIGPRQGEARPVFERVAKLRDTLRADLGLDLPTLSFGMSSDIDAAVAAGTTIVRVGTALFGPRAQV